jgi:hypothetical protein
LSTIYITINIPISGWETIAESGKSICCSNVIVFLKLNLWEKCNIYFGRGRGRRREEKKRNYNG